ncbi:Peptide transporter [Lachnellula occidentalis]|uniref:Peptide transporter n=1 Tax=Lachnellula occidentalis TaxID=215460 RepID=A0A8H8UH01_9HELO|nr:Peptide transporter [Lachnellula occidentalis]
MAAAAATDVQTPTDLQVSGSDVGHILASGGKLIHHVHSVEIDIGIAEMEAASLSSGEDGREPSEHEKQILRKVAGPVTWAGYVLCFVEAANNASYYGVSGVFANYIQRPLPAGGNGQVRTQLSAGALGLGLQAAQAVTVLFTFLVYCTPLLGGYLADAKLGRYKACWYGILTGIIAHVLLVIAAIPSVINAGHALAPFVIGIIILAFASGFIKPTITPMIADQSTVKRAVIKTLKSGEKVIVDPNATIERMLLLYYWASNLGDFFSIATTYSEKLVGFWLAYMLPCVVYMFCPLCMLWVKSRIVMYPPGGSSVGDGAKVIGLVYKEAHGFKTKDEHWDAVKPSKMMETGKFDTVGDKHKPDWISWDDKFVDEVRTTLKACRVFALMPIWYMADGGTTTILTNMAGSMTTNGLPNDLLNNFNPISTVIAIPIYNWVLYPGLRKRGISFSLIQRMSCGYFIGAILNACAAIIQWQIYKTSPCGYHATDCNIGTGVSPLSAWLTVIPFWLQPLGGIMISVSSYEIAYTMTPPRMKGSVMAIVFFTSAISQAIIEIASPVFKDPHLIWPFVAIGIANLFASFFNWYFFRDIEQRDHTDLNRMDLTEKEIAAVEASKA